MIQTAFSGIYGNDALCEMLSRQIAGDLLPHAYLIEGDEGSGRHMLAMGIACALYPAEAEKIRSGNCPDVIAISLEGDRKSMGVETIRALRESAYISPNELDGKLYVISDADAMTAQAQNAFLKLLEEPPRQVRFLLLCENASALIPTVRSRAPTLKMRAFSTEELSVYLLSSDSKAASLQKSDPVAFGALLRMADGSIGRAKKLLSSRKRDDTGIDAVAIGLLRSLLSDSRFAFLRTADALPSGRDALRTVLRAFRAALRDILLMKDVMLHNYSEEAMASVERRLLFFGSAAEAESFASRMTDRTVMRLDAIAGKTDAVLGANVNLSHAELSMALEMRDAVGK